MIEALKKATAEFKKNLATCTIDHAFETGFSAGWNARNIQSDSKETCVKPTDSVKPEVGKRYVMKNGDVTGKLCFDDTDNCPYYDPEYGFYYYADGACQNASDRDIVSEYIEQPEETVFKTQQDIHKYCDINGNLVQHYNGVIVGYIDGRLCFIDNKKEYENTFFTPLDWKPYHKTKDWRDTVSPENPVFCWVDDIEIKDKRIAAYVTEYNDRGNLKFKTLGLGFFRYAKPVATGKEYDTLIKILKGGE